MLSVKRLISSLTLISSFRKGAESIFSANQKGRDHSGFRQGCHSSTCDAVGRAAGPWHIHKRH